MARSKEAAAKKEEKLAELLTAADGSSHDEADPGGKGRRDPGNADGGRREDRGLDGKNGTKSIPLLLADRDAKEAKYKEAKAALDTAGGEFQTARAAVSSESQSFDHAISRQEMILLESADPALDEAITFFREKLDWLRDPIRISTERSRRGETIYLRKK